MVGAVLYNEKVDVFSLAVVMYELCSYTPTVALVTGEDMVDRMFQYAEKVAGGFRQVLPYRARHSPCDRTLS